MYLEDRLMLELLGVGSAMEWRLTAVQKRDQLVDSSSDVKSV